MNLKTIFQEIKENLHEKALIRQEVYTNMSRSRQLSKQAIFLLHKDHLKEAEEMLNKSEELLINLKNLSGLATCSNVSKLIIM